jgi:hypothetical protein
MSDSDSEEEEEEDEEFKSVFNRLKKVEVKLFPSPPKTLLYEWLIDLLPRYFLKKYKVRRPKRLLLWKDVKKLLKCESVSRTGIFEKSFLACKCDNNKEKYFVSTVHLKVSDKELEDVWLPENPYKPNKFFLLLKELLISIKLNIFSGVKLVKKHGRMFPICNNFVKTFYVCRDLVTNGFSALKYVIIQERLHITLEQFVYTIENGIIVIENKLEKELNQYRKKRDSLVDRMDKEKNEEKKTKLEQQHIDVVEKILETEDEKLSLYDDIMTENITLAYFQIIYGLYCADSAFRLRHNDLHQTNVMVSIINDKDFDGFVFVVNKNLMFKFPKSFNYMVKIIDFNRSHIKRPADTHEHPSPKNKKLIDYILDLLSSFSFTIDGFTYNERLLVERNRGFSMFYKDFDMQRLHYGLTYFQHFENYKVKKRIDGMKDIMSLTAKPLSLFEKFKTRAGMYEYHLDLFKDPVFEKYRVKNVDWDKLNPKYTFIYSEINRVKIKESDYIDYDYLVCKQ